MISRAGRSDGLEQPTLPGALGGESSNPPSAKTLAPRESEVSAGTALLVRSFARSGDVLSIGGPASAVGSAGGGVSASALEQKIRKNPAYQGLSAGDRGVAEWILWRASLGDPQKRAYYLGKLDTLFNTAYVKRPDLGETELEKINSAEVDAALARERARGDVFKGEEEQSSAAARLTSRVGFNGIRYQVDGRDPRAVVVKLKVHLTGKPELIAKIKDLEDAIDKAASTTGYRVDLEFVDKWGPNVFHVKTDSTQWPKADNWASGVQTLAHELHHLLGLDDRYDYIEAHAANKFIPTSERLYLFAIQMMKPADPRGFASFMDDQFSGTLLSEDVCGVLQDRSARCIDARKEWDPPGLPAYDTGVRGGVTQ